MNQNYLSGLFYASRTNSIFYPTLSSCFNSLKHLIIIFLNSFASQSDLHHILYPMWFRFRGKYAGG